MAYPEPMTSRTGTRRSEGGWLRKALVWALILLVGAPVALVAIYRFAPPPVTILMVQRSLEGQGFSRTWRPLDEMSPALIRSVIAAEDAGFCTHRGFELEAIQAAWEHNERSDRLRGGSTISQQTAKNVFLWPQRSYLRKGLEAGFTVLIELGWGKRRILEVYLNTIEWGPGVYLSLIHI